MFREINDRRFLALLTLTILGAVGCSTDERVTQVALEATARQASQNQELAQLNREVAQGTRQLIETRGAADQQILRQQATLQSERDQLDAERRAITVLRNHESTLAAVLITAGSLWVCSLPLVLCWYLLHRLGAEAAETQLTQLLVDQLADQPAAVLLSSSQLTAQTSHGESVLSERLTDGSHAS